MKGEREGGGRYDRRRVRGDRQDIPVESSDSVMFYQGRLRPDEGVLRPELSHPGSCVQVSLSRVRESSSDEEALARERASCLPLPTPTAPPNRMCTLSSQLLTRRDLTLRLSSHDQPI